MRVGRRAVSAVISSVVVVACAMAGAAIAEPFAGKWSIAERTDPITGRPAARVFLETTAYNGRTHRKGPAIVQLVCNNNQAAVRFAYWYRIGSNSTASLQYRFDKTPGGTVEARFLPDFKTVVIEEKAAVAAFVQMLERSSYLYVRVLSLPFGHTIAEYRTEGAPAAIAAA